MLVKNQNFSWKALFIYICLELLRLNLINGDDNEDLILGYKTYEKSPSGK